MGECSFSIHEGAKKIIFHRKRNASKFIGVLLQQKIWGTSLLKTSEKMVRFSFTINGQKECF